VSLYDDIGGSDAVKVAVTVFYNRVLADDRCNAYFAGIDMDRLAAHLVTALGGPDLFTGRALGEAHRAFAITDEAYDAVVENLAASLIDVGVERSIVRRVIDRVEGLRADVVAAPQHAG
jgi:hemoglobin